MNRKVLAFAVAFSVVLFASASQGATTKKDRERIERKRTENLERKFRHYYDQENASFVKKLKELAQWCAASGLANEAAEIWDTAKAADPSIKDDAPAGAADVTPTPENLALWPAKKREVIRGHADALFTLGGNCFKSGLLGRAYDMVWEVVAFNPDHATARKLLGQVKYGDKWVDKYDAAQVRQGKTWHDKLGWVGKQIVQHFEKGEMFYQGRWMPIAKVEEIRSSWGNCWTLNTEHYKVKTNVSLADAVAFENILEENYKLFFRVFISYFSSKDQGEMLFGSKAGKNLMAVNYYTTAEEYAKHVGIKLKGTAGVYLGAEKSANFFRIDWNSNIRILKHECTHQLFFESRRVFGMSTYGAWVVEAGATYMESCRRVDGKLVTEGREAPWVKQYRALLGAGGKVTSLETLDQCSYEAFQGLPAAYPQAAALACFLMEAQDGNYREAFVDYIEAYYTSKLNKGGVLDEYVGVPYDELEDEFHKYILGQDDEKKDDEKKEDKKP